MENCKSINLLFSEAFYGELKDRQLQDFNKHLSGCNNCSVQYKEFTTTLNIMSKRKRPEMKDEFWDNYWDNLSEKAFVDKPTFQEKARNSLSLLFVDHRKFAFPTAALVLILFGLLMGKILFSPDKTHIIQQNKKTFSNNLNRSGNKNSQYFMTVNNHMDNLKPIFTEYSNYQASNENDAEFLSIKKELLKKLLLQNYLLKRMADKKNDPQLKTLIEDLQLILMEIINSGGTGNEKIDSVKHMLDSNDVIFKMNMLKKKNRYINIKKPGEII